MNFKPALTRMTRIIFIRYDPIIFTMGDDTNVHKQAMRFFLFWQCAKSA